MACHALRSVRIVRLSLPLPKRSERFARRSASAAMDVVAAAVPRDDVVDTLEAGKVVAELVRTTTCVVAEDVAVVEAFGACDVVA